MQRRLTLEIGELAPIPATAKPADEVITKLNKIKKEMRIMTQICEKLVTAASEFPTINDGMPLQMEVSSEFPLFYRIELKGLISPLKFKIKVDSEQSPIFEIALSTKTEFPSFQNCELKFSNETNFVVKCS